MKFVENRSQRNIVDTPPVSLPAALVLTHAGLLLNSNSQTSRLVHCTAAARRAVAARSEGLAEAQEARAELLRISARLNATSSPGATAAMSPLENHRAGPAVHASTPYKPATQVLAAGSPAVETTAVGTLASVL